MLTVDRVERNKQVAKLRLDGKTLQEIVDIVGISQPSVCRILRVMNIKRPVKKSVKKACIGVFKYDVWVFFNMGECDKIVIKSDSILEASRVVKDDFKGHNGYIIIPKIGRKSMRGPVEAFDRYWGDEC
jgi:DNA-directed RNA polymerase specialized sigma subunit